MVVDTASLVPGLYGAAEGGLNIIIYVIIGIVVLVILAIVFFLWLKKKQWNLDVEFKLTRTDGRITNAEWGKGH